MKKFLLLLREDMYELLKRETERESEREYMSMCRFIRQCVRKELERRGKM